MALKSRDLAHIFEKGGHTSLFSERKCGNTKEECPPRFLSFKKHSFLGKNIFIRCELQGNSIDRLKIRVM